MKNIEAIAKLFKEGEIWFAAADQKNPRRTEQTQTHCKDGDEGPRGDDSGEQGSRRLQLLKLQQFAEKHFDFRSLGKFVAPFGIPEIDNRLPFGGLAFGHTHDWFYAPPDNSNRNEILSPCTILSILCGNAVELITHRSASAKLLLWIGKRCWPTPYILEENLKFVRENRTIDYLQNCLFIDPPNQRLRNWAIETALKSGAAAIVIADCSRLKLGEARRFSLAAKNGNSLGLLIRDPSAMQFVSPAASAWSVTPLPSPSFDARWKLSLLRLKGARSAETNWHIEATRSAGQSDYEKISLHIPSELVSGSRQEIERRRRA